MKKYVGFAIYGIVVFFVGFFIGKNSNSIPKLRQIVIHDTTLIQKWDRKIERDTVIKLLDKIILKEIPSKTIAYQTIDSLYKKKMEKLNLFIDANKKGDSLKVLTINFDRKAAKEFTFPSSLKEFTLIAKNDDLLYTEKRNLFEFLGVNFGVGIDYNTLICTKKYFLEISTGFILLNKFQMNSFINTNNDLGIRIYYKLNF